MGLLGAFGSQSTGALWLQISSKSLRLDNGQSGTDSNNTLMTDKYPALKGLGYSKAVVPFAPGVLKIFVEMFKGQVCFLPPTQLIKDKEGKILPGYEGVTTIGTVTLEEMMDLPATSVARAPSTRTRGTVAPAPELTEEQLQAKLDDLKATKAAEAKAEADAKAARIKEAKDLLAADAEINKVSDTTKKDFVGKETKAPIK
jgi:hypothetical protein